MSSIFDKYFLRSFSKGAEMLKRADSCLKQKDAKPQIALRLSVLL
jgi:hypothetical protein